LEQVALALKTAFALNSRFWVYIFYHSGFLSNLRLPWKRRLPWNFSKQGGRPALPTPCLVRLWVCGRTREEHDDRAVTRKSSI